MRGCVWSSWSSACDEWALLWIRVSKNLVSTFVGTYVVSNIDTIGIPTVTVWIVRFSVRSGMPLLVGIKSPSFSNFVYLFQYSGLCHLSVFVNVLTWCLSFVSVLTWYIILSFTVFLLTGTGTCDSSGPVRHYGSGTLVCGLSSGSGTTVGFVSACVH
jgi:hypothetical protein